MAGRPIGPLDRLAAPVGGGALLVMTAQFGRSPVRQAAYRLRTRRPDLNFKLSWRAFDSLPDWGERWQAEQNDFAAGVVLSAAGNPVVERAVGRCMVDLARLDRPLLWGVCSDRIRWCPCFTVSPNGWSPEDILPWPATYARLRAAPDGVEFKPKFDPILYATNPDFFIFDGRLRWLEDRHFQVVARDG